VPHALLHEQVDVRITTRVIEIFHQSKRVAVHQRRFTGERSGTELDHMPSHHRFLAEWSPDRFASWARSFGPNTEALILALLANRRHPEQAFRTCLGVLKLFRGLEAGHVEAAATRAVEIGALNYARISSILKHRLGRAEPAAESASIDHHPNIRGPGYFH
jgi:transposase